jgi:hypothetical protein
MIRIIKSLNKNSVLVFDPEDDLNRLEYRVFDHF